MSQTSTKWRAVVAALRQRWRAGARVLVFWHVDLLKLLPFFGGSPRVALFLHGVEAWRPLDWATRRLLHRVDLFMSNTTYTWERFLGHYPALEAAKHRTVHLGIGEPATGAPETAATPAAVMIGRLVRGEEYKGHREMIRVWPDVARQVPGAELWIVGDGDLRPDLEALAAEQGGTQGVRFWGRLPEPDKEGLLGKARCLAMPSSGEGFGLVYLEAMRLGRPCLVGMSDGAREVVAPPLAGLAVDPSDTAAVAAAVRRMLGTGPEWRAWSDAARLRYAEHFTSHHFQRRLLDALEPYLAGVQRGTPASA